MRTFSKRIGTFADSMVVGINKTFNQVEDYGLQMKWK